jgi:hypothetical protein
MSIQMSVLEANCIRYDKSGKQTFHGGVEILGCRVLDVSDLEVQYKLVVLSSLALKHVMIYCGKFGWDKGISVEPGLSIFIYRVFTYL